MKSMGFRSLRGHRPALRRQRYFAAIAVGAALSLAAMACACNVPVFRFALERWRPDVYRVTLLHRGPLNEAQQEIAKPLQVAQEKGSANFVLQVVDVNELEKPGDGNSVPLAGPLTGVWSRIGMGEAWLVVQYPAQLRIGVPVWSGPLAAEAVTRLTGSPIRQELVRRLAEGQSAVWLLLESGNEARDNAAADLLEEELHELQRSLKLPELTADPDDELLARTPLKLAFSVLRVPKSTAAEEALAGMLVRCEPDLADRSDPMVFPVFGRGRALLPLIGAGITAKNIHDAAEFLVGPCSCQVKEQNPGFDILLPADWDVLLSQSGQQLTAYQTRGLVAESKETELVPIPSGSTPSDVSAPEVLTVAMSHTQTVASVSFWPVIGGVVFLFLLVAMVVVVTQARARRAS
jgi:hypothetical protein